MPEPSTGKRDGRSWGGRSPEVGSDPDYRFSLANERTFLSWIRTALALDAGALAAVQFLPTLVLPGVRELLALVLGITAAVMCITSYRRWVRYETALRTDAPLPPIRTPMLLAIIVGVVSIAAVVLLSFAQLAT